MADAKLEELSVPPDALEKGGVEILRASIVEGAVSVAMRRAFDDPFTWGILLVDRLDLHGRLVGLDLGDDVARLDRVPLLLEPLGQVALFHGGRERGHQDGDGHAG